jgi:hypothetical protein
VSARPKLFALDQNFPQPLVDAAAPFFRGVRLLPIWTVNRRMADLEDWEVLLALHHHELPFDGLITTDSSMLNQPRELAVVRQTNLTLVVTRGAGHDPVRATGLLLAHLDYVASETTPTRPQIWDLRVRNRPARDPWDAIELLATHQNRSARAVWTEGRLTNVELARNPLAD